MKPATDNMVEGRAALDAFRDAMRKIVAVSHSVIQQREAQYKRQSNGNPNRRGPKPKNAVCDGTDDLIAQMRQKRGTK